MAKRISFFLILLIITAFAAGFVFLGSHLKPAEAGTNDNVSGWAWSETIGWISFNNTFGGGSTNYGVNIDSTGIFSGYAWSEHIGWVSFNEADLSGCPSPAPCRAWVNLSNYQVFGWARALAAKDAGSNSGGWDGWISLRGTSPDYGVWIDTNVSPGNPAEFRNWAWGSDVVGWISFNCKDGGNCSTSNYKVITTFAGNNPNHPPEKPTTSETWDHCSIQGLSIPTFNWTYSDQDGNPQKRYEIKIYGETTLDRTVNSPSTSFTVPSYWVRDNLYWNKTYTWQVRVQDNQDAWSEWSDLDSFPMPIHAHPWIDFSWTPPFPAVDEIVDFTDGSNVYGGANKKSWLWEIPDWTYEEGYNQNSQNPQGKFTISGDKIVHLTVTDTDNFQCTGEDTVTSELPLPEWKEIAPF